MRWRATPGSGVLRLVDHEVREDAGLDATECLAHRPGCDTERAGDVALGALVLGNLLLDSDALWILLAAFTTSGIVSSWAGVTRWAVPYSAATAAPSMAVVNAVAAVVLFATALEE